MSETQSTDERARKEAHWAKTRALMITVIVLWFVFAVAVHWFATSLNVMSFIGFPLGYYMAVQGSLIVFVLLIFFLNWRQDQIDNEFGLRGEE